MTMPAGTRLGPYEILAPIGSGGMGEVYRARDTRLDRDAAIKVLNPETALKADARARFEREARAASALSHPNVAHIYEIGDGGGRRFIAMEYVDGPRLDQKMDGTPMPPEQIIEIAKPMSSLVGLQAEMSQALARRIDPSLDRPEHTRIGARQTANSEAYQLYLKGRYHWNKRTEAGFRLGLENFRQAIDHDPTYAAAYAGLADCYSLLARYRFEPPAESFRLARAAARKALDLDDTSAEVHVSLAYVSFNYDYDWAGAERGFQRAIELDPKYATAQHWYGLLKSALGDHAGSLELLREAQRVEPLSPIIAANVARIEYYGGRYEEALEGHRKALLLDPNFGEGLLRLGWVYDQMGRYDEAIATYRQAIDRSGTQAQGAMGHALARAGRAAEARAVLRELETQSRSRHIDPYDIALIQIGLGQVNEAFAALNRAVDERSGMVVYARVDPKLNPLRSDPRFAALLERMNLQSAGK
jgi:tetratricopeptide (TPR) repeat protein